MKTATKEIGGGVIGVGMGRNMLRINDDPESTLVVRAICDVSPDAVRRVASEHNREALYETGDYREILDRSDIDVVGIYRLDHLHMQHLRDALESGKHVNCTKPMVLSLEEAKATVDPVRKTGKKLLVGQTCRFVPRFMAAKTLLDDGDLGRLLFVEQHYVHEMRTLFDLTPWRCEAPQDFIYGGACHPVDLLRWIAGGILEVSCYSQASGMDSRYPEGVMENLLMNLRFENGVVGRVLAVFGLVEPPQTMNGLAVYGTEGIFVEDSAIFNRLEGLPEWNMEFRPEAGHGNEVLRYMRRFEECVAACSAARESARSLQPLKAFNDF